MNKAHVLWPWVAVLAYMALIFAFSSCRVLPQPDISGIDKPEHYIEYGGFAIVLMFALTKSLPKIRLPLIAIIAVGFASIYAVTDELHQWFVPTRCCDVSDWVADTLGAISGVVVFLLIRKLVRRKKSVLIKQ